MQAAKERLAVPKKLLACNTKLKNYMTDSLAIVKMKLSCKHSYIHRSIETVFFCSFLTCIVPVFPLTLLLYPSYTPVKIVASDLRPLNINSK